MADAHQVEAGPPGRDVTAMLARAARSGDPTMLAQLQVEFRRRRITGERVIDIYIPAAVEILGAAWHEDQITVLQATLAFARLQDLLRELSIACTADHVGRPDGPRVLLVIPQREQHTIGALLAASRMRRLGVSVRVEYMAGPTEVTELLAAQGFDAIFLSASNLNTIVTCERIVEAIRRAGQSGIPVVVGGPIATLAADEAGAIGADLVSRNVDQALKACGLLDAVVAAR
jgi:MerR family transcriptional regulator, light-induced transcriptional regulator